MLVTVHRTVAEVLPFAGIWTEMAAQETAYAPPFEDLTAALSPPDLDFRFITVSDGGEVRALACFMLWRARRTYWLSQLRLFSLTVPSAALFEAGMLGAPSCETAGLILRTILAEPDAGILDLGDIPTGSGLHEATQALGWRFIVHDNPRNATRRMLPLADGFDAYVECLRPSTRKAVRRDCRLFARLSPEFRTFSTPDEVAFFLREASPVWKRTYQTLMGMTLEDDDATQAKFRRLAAQGRMRAYLAYVDGKPCAFAWGDVAHGIFYFRMTGYDPDMRKHCAGTALLFHILQDLAGQDICASFDFGIRDMDYKERFGTIAMPYTTVSIARWAKAAAIMAIMADGILDGLKSGIDRMMGADRRARIRRILRG